MTNGAPDPDPKTGIAHRLESVRRQTGYEHSLRAFWRRLTEGWDDENAVSYEAVRRYHYNREPPISYLVRVVEVFPQYSLAWLATGEEEALESSRRTAEDALREVVSEAYPERFRDLLTDRAQGLFLDVLMERMRTAPDAPEWVRGVAWEEPGEVPEEVVEHAGDLLHVLFYPVWREIRPEREERPASHPAWGVVDPRNVTPGHVEKYVLRFLDALEELIPGPGEADTWERVEKSQHRVDRMVAEADRERLAEKPNEEES